MSKAMITVLNRCLLKPGQTGAAQKIYDEWVQFLKAHHDCKSTELVCCVEGQLVWLEQWSSKAALDKFTAEHMAYTDYIARLFACSRGAPVRDIFQHVR